MTNLIPFNDYCQNIKVKHLNSQKKIADDGAGSKFEKGVIVGN